VLALARKTQTRAELLRTVHPRAPTGRAGSARTTSASAPGLSTIDERAISSPENRREHGLAECRRRIVGGNANQLYTIGLNTKRVDQADLKSAPSTIVANRAIAQNYARDGFVFPLDVISVAEAGTVLADLEAAEAELAGLSRPVVAVFRSIDPQSTPGRRRRQRSWARPDGLERRPV
jgi:hypothetical protein